MCDDVPISKQTAVCPRCGETDSQPKHLDCADPTIMCRHEESGRLAVARTVESGLKINKRRATLDLVCPYSTDDPERQKILLKEIANCLSQFSVGMKKQITDAWQRMAKEIETYAERTEMEVIAEFALD